MKTFKATPSKTMVTATREQLRETGKPFSGVTLRAGETIEFPPMAEINCQIDLIGPEKKTKVPCINVIHNGTPRYIPFGSFLKTPFGNFAEPFLAKYPTNREIVECGDNEQRLDLFAGRTLKVTEVVVDQRAYFRKAADGSYELARNPEDNSPATQPGNFPIFEWVQ